MTPEEVLATIHRLRNPEWQDNFRRWIAVMATGEDGQVPRDERILEWLKEPEILIRVSALVRRVPASWLREEA